MNLIIIGAGGLAREAYDLAIVCYGHLPDFKIKGFLSEDKTNIEELGYPPILSKPFDYELQSNDVFFCAIGNIFHRKKSVENILLKGGKFINLIHPTANLSPSVKLGTGVAIKSYCVISSDVTIGNFCYLQSSVIMGHDVKIGDYCQINYFAFFAGYVNVDQCVSINAGAKLIQNVVVEEEAVVGVGSVVLSKVKKGTTVFGIPAKRLSL
jgi:sugar O-acyltransferase (sialic acid O-acetyltransferase NeuD family)